LSHEKLTVICGQGEDLQIAQAIRRLEHFVPLVPQGVREGRHDGRGSWMRRRTADSEESLKTGASSFLHVLPRGKMKVNKIKHGFLQNH